MAEKLSVCHRCEMVGSEVEGRAHAIARGHEVEVLDEKTSAEVLAAIDERNAQESAERISGLLSLARLSRSTQPHTSETQQ